ncbi:MAG: lysine--tRNA ligase, partial [Spirochaetales bacterium]|nr:lysine--tRNA ligase [Spirochaetales bacterium]
MGENNSGLSHWADIAAAKIIREKGDREVYTCASGITPSGTVHIGNFREIISTDLVVRALRGLGKKARFIYSWDDYDVFRKVPKNMPGQEMLKEHLRRPITLVPDPWGRDGSYAQHHELDVERELHRVGIAPEYLYQARRYRESLYAEQIKTALSKAAEIRALLDKHRTDALAADWLPVAVFCGGCDRDTTSVLSWDGGYGL